MREKKSARGPPPRPPKRSRRASSSGGGCQADRDAARPEKSRKLPEAPGDACAAVLAGAVFSDVIRADAVPVALDEALLARWAVGRAASAVVHVAGVDVIESRELRDLARARQRRRGRCRDVGHLPVG